MRLEDIECRMMINILSIIKYFNLNSLNTIGTGINNSIDAVQNDWNNCEFDGYQTTMNTNASIKIMGLIDWYGNVWESVDNAMAYQNYLYINDSKGIVDFPSITDAATKGWINTGNVIPESSGSYFSKFHNNLNFPYLLTPSTLGGDTKSPIGDSVWGSSTQNSVIVGGVNSYNACGLFSFYSNCIITYDANWLGARYIV